MPGIDDLELKNLRDDLESVEKEAYRLTAENVRLRKALTKITNTSVGIDEKNGCQRAWSECCKIARDALSHHPSK